MGYNVPAYSYVLHWRGGNLFEFLYCKVGPTTLYGFVISFITADRVGRYQSVLYGGVKSRHYGA